MVPSGRRGLSVRPCSMWNRTPRWVGIGGLVRLLCRIGVKIKLWDSSSCHTFVLKMLVASRYVLLIIQTRLVLTCKSHGRQGPALREHVLLINKRIGPRTFNCLCSVGISDRRHACTLEAFDWFTKAVKLFLSVIYARFMFEFIYLACRRASLTLEILRLVLLRDFFSDWRLFLV